MDLSIIIPSFKRSHLLRFGLTSISLQKVTSQFEVIVLNDGVLDETQQVCDEFKGKIDIKYFFTGQRNCNGDKWRVPGFAVNIGVKQSTGKNIVIACPEIYLIDTGIIQQYINTLNTIPRSLVVTEGKDDVNSILLSALTARIGSSPDIIYNSGPSRMNTLNTMLPFFMGMNKDEFVKIGGYDEDFIGYCWDDNDLVDRLVWNGCRYQKVPGRIVHLFHPRILLPGVGETHRLWIHNHNVYLEKKGIIERNKNREWGVLNVAA